MQRLKTALQDRYRVEREIGAGGMAIVYLAHDLKHDRRVAIKVLRPELAAALGPERFLREIQTVAKLTHPHILPLYDSGEADGFLYYVMPYIEGESLRAKLEHEGELPVGTAVRILREIVDALAYAHEHGVVHRDIKPDNVLISGQHALVTDFGVAKAVSEATGRQELTTAGVALGTPAYMAPEQATADPLLDHRVDIYAVGALAYELLAGRPPFTGPTPQAILAAHVTEAPEPITKHRPAVPEAMGQLVMKCLEKKAADRWQTAAELLPLLDTASTPGAGVTPTDTRPIKASPRVNTRMTGVGIGVVAAAIIGAAFVLRSPSPAPGITFGPATQVTRALGLELDPELASDGRTLAYAAGPAGQMRIYARQLGGGGLIALTEGVPGNHRSPRFSPDASEVVYQSGGSGNGSGSTEVGFQIQPGITLEYTQGPPGNSIQIFGSGFGTNEPNISLVYDSTPVVSGISADAVGSFQESFDIPLSGAGTHTIQAKSPFSGATGTPEQGFSVSPSLTLSEITGNVGLKVMVSGQGFDPNSTVTLTYDELDHATLTADVDKSGSFRFEFQIPESRQGDHVIRLDDLQNKQQISFTIEDTPPPAPSLREPNDGGSGGFLGGFRPATIWSAVEDPSGIRYTLQIAADRDFDEIILEKEGLENPRYTLAEEEKLPRGDYFWRVKAVDKASNESGWSNSYAVKSGLMPIWLLATLVALGLVATGGGAYAFINSRRRRVREEAVPPEFIRILQPEAAPALGAPTAAPSLAAPTRRALPSPFRRSRSLSPEEQARLQLVVDFVNSIPLLEISSDLAWLEEMIESMGGVKEELYERVLEGAIDLTYQPAWLQHPTYEELRLIPQAEPFLQGLEGYIGVVNECASNTLVLLRRIAGDLSTAPPLETLSGNQWRFALTVGLGTLAWFRGTYLGQPSARDYLIQAGEVSEAWDPDEPAPMELHGTEASPFPGLILNGLSEEDANFFRDLHIQLRIGYRNYEEARTLASRLASTDAMRGQITEGISQLRQQSQRQ